MSPDEEWSTSMRRGDFDAAWRVSDGLMLGDRAAYKHLPRPFQPVWDGTTLRGRRVLIRCHRGLGDTLQFCRYVPLVRALAVEVTVCAQTSLHPLLKTVPGVDRLIPLEDSAVEVAYDVDVEIMELPYVFRSTLHTIPRRVPYIRVEPAELDRSSLTIGLVWRASDRDPQRSIPFRLLQPLTRLPVRWYVLQGHPGIAECPPDLGVIVGTDSVLEAAQVMAAVDLLITVDTMAAHLGGAVGAPVWTLLHTDADWRWMNGTAESPWYPSMRLFRQDRPGDWSPVIDRVTSELARLLAKAA